MKKTIFLTGSKGFIGSHLLPRLTDYNVICAGHNELPVETPDYIIHLAATTTTSDEFIPELWENNVVYANKIMQYPCKILYASSTSASELTNPYAYTKRYLEYLGEKHGNAIGMRFFNVYGPKNNKGIVKRAIDCCRTGEILTLSGGFQIRDFIHIDDVVCTIISLLEPVVFYPPKPQIIDIGTGVGLTIHSAIHIIESAYRNAINLKITEPSKTDMEYSVARPGIYGCLSFDDGIAKMLNT